VDVQLNLGLNIRIPAEYIGEENQRLRAYKRVAGVESASQLADIRAELEDRYGAPPAAVENLFHYAELRLLCRALGVAAIDRKRDQMTVKFTEVAAIDPARLAKFVSSERGAQFSPSGTLTFSIRSHDAAEVLERLQNVLSDLAENQQPAPVA
jgi:transcription-repair coupling factor (superfamily II helicase)